VVVPIHSMVKLRFSKKLGKQLIVALVFVMLSLFGSNSITSVFAGGSCATNPLATCWPCDPSCTANGNVCAETAGWKCYTNPTDVSNVCDWSKAVNTTNCPDGKTCQWAPFTSNVSNSCGNGCIRVNGTGTITPTPTITGNPTTTPSITGEPPITFPPTLTPPMCWPCLGSNTCGEDVPSSKWRQKPKPHTGEQKVCTNNSMQCPTLASCECPSTIQSCTWTEYKNTAPSCTITIDKPSVNRKDNVSPKITLSVQDKDYGDTVQLSGYSVSNYCAKILTTGGTEPQNLVVKAGSDNPNDTTASVVFNVDHINAHGIFTPDPTANNPFRSLCNSTITFEITDVKGDELDATTTRQCSASFRVVNDAPELASNVEIYDLDPVTNVRTSGNLVNGNAIYVASSNVNERPNYCSDPLNANTLECAGAKSPVKTRTNPFDVVYTVRDDNGLKDINYASLWLQKNGEPNYPVQTGGGRRKSVQGIFSDYRTTELNNRFEDDNRFHWITRADFNTNLLTASNPNSNFFGIRTGLTGTGSYVASKRFQVSTFQQWQAQGFPDCLDKSNKCKFPNNVPNSSQALLSTDRNDRGNYTWDVTADTPFNKSQKWVCYDTDLTTKLVDNCDGTCAACIRRSPSSASNGVEQVDANTLRFRFQLQVNDRMLEGNYSLRLTADDKVGSRLNNSSNEWVAVRRNGVVCAAGNCANGNNLDIYLDKTAPDATISFQQGTGDELRAVVTGLNDFTEGSGVAGKYGLVMMRQTEAGTKEFLKTRTGCTLDGSANSVNCAAAGIAEGYTFSGVGLQGGDIVSAYVCIYDRAGNGACKKDKYQAYTVQDNWVKTSLGTIYSNSQVGSNRALKVQLPSAPNDRSKAAKTGVNQPSLTYNSYVDQKYTLLTGMFITGAQAAGVQGGNSDQFPSGFQGAYRNLTSNSWLRVGITDTTSVTDWYARTLALANFNCPNLGSNCVRFTAGDKNQFAAQLADASAAFKIITVNANMTIDFATISCRNNTLIFVPTGINVAISSQLVKATGTDNCVFVIADGGKLSILDNETQQFEKDNSPSTEKDVDIDIFQASIIAEGTFETVKGNKGADEKFDQLQIHGFVFSRKTTPKLGRDLVFSENTKYPSEWLFYDSTVLHNLRDILGTTKYIELKCGTSAHPVCSDK
jgi:hypothetical protein